MEALIKKLARLRFTQSLGERDNNKTITLPSVCVIYRAENAVNPYPIPVQPKPKFTLTRMKTSVGEKIHQSLTGPLIHSSTAAVCNE